MCKKYGIYGIFFRKLLQKSVLNNKTTKLRHSKQRKKVFRHQKMSGANLKFRGMGVLNLFEICVLGISDCFLVI